jgi:4-diphosphocytidyl-2-C-methyl-D-erythritol kinase
MAQLSAPSQSNRLVAQAYAKINLGLEVLGKRADGLHEVATIMQTIDLADRLELSPSEDVQLHCRGMRVEPDNLILRAAHLIKDRGSVAEGCAITCVKHIPISAGLGGGSADAAATLCALWNYWGVRLDAATLTDLAGTLGADVPFALSGGTALATGSGRDIEPLPAAPAHWVVLVKLEAPDALKTAGMYSVLTPVDWTDGSRTRLQAEAVRNGQLDYGAIGSAFELHARERWPLVGPALDLLEEEGALAASVSGSGPSAFGLFLNRQSALPALHRLRRERLPVSLHRFVGPFDCRTRARAQPRRLRLV